MISRERKIVEMVTGLMLSEVSFQDLLKKYRGHSLRFSDVGTWVDDKGQSVLYGLKEICHSLFRSNGKISFNRNTWLLDLVIGSIFHEAMKLRENIYQLEFYRPKYHRYRSKTSRLPYEMDYLKLFERIISKAQQGVSSGMEECRFLFQDARVQLVDFFRDNRENGLLVRFLLENQDLLRKVYGTKMAKEIFEIMFDRGFLDAYLLTGDNYLQSEHYDLSAFYYAKASKLSPACRDLECRLAFSLGMKAYFDNAYLRALSHFKRLASLWGSEKMKKEHLTKAIAACHRIASEWKEEKRLKRATQARLLADQLRKCYQKSKGA
jgi:hypothetical protein